MAKDNEVTSNIKKVVVIGPECTGKSSLSAALAEYYNTRWVPEYAREYIDQLNRPYIKEDLKQIALGQLALEDAHAKQVEELLICDTDLIVLKVWAEHKYGQCDPSILQMMSERHYDLYLLTDIDIPWEEDPQRENPHLREHFYEVFRSELEQIQTPFVKVSGSFEIRKQNSIDAINKILKENEPN